MSLPVGAQAGSYRRADLLRFIEQRTVGGDALSRRWVKRALVGNTRQILAGKIAATRIGKRWFTTPELPICCCNPEPLRELDPNRAHRSVWFAISYKLNGALRGIPHSSVATTGPYHAHRFTPCRLSFRLPRSGWPVRATASTCGCSGTALMTSPSTTRSRSTCIGVEVRAEGWARGQFRLAIDAPGVMGRDGLRACGIDTPSLAGLGVETILAAAAVPNVDGKPNPKVVGPAIPMLTVVYQPVEHNGHRLDAHAVVQPDPVWQPGNALRKIRKALAEIATEYHKENGWVLAPEAAPAA